MIDELDGLVKPVAAMERIIQDQKGIYWQLFWHGYRLRLGGKDKGLWFVKHYDDPVGGDAERHDAIRRMNDHHRERILSALNPDAIEALRSAPDVGWQPIETAPKDGSMILVCLPRMMNLIVRARFSTVHKHFLHDYEGEGGISRAVFFHEGDLWQPMPEPPCALADQTKEAGDAEAALSEFHAKGVKPMEQLVRALSQREGER